VVNISNKPGARCVLDEVMVFHIAKCRVFHCLCSSLFFLSLTSISCLGHAGLFPSLPDFLHLGIESSCALWNTSLKTCQLCSVPLSLRTVSQGVLLTISLKSWKFALLKFRVLTMLFVIPISLSSISSTSAWSLQPRLPPILTSPTSSLALVTTRSSIASPRVGVLITWLKKLSSMHSRNLLDCLQLAVLLFQQTSGS